MLAISLPRPTLWRLLALALGGVLFSTSLVFPVQAAVPSLSNIQVSSITSSSAVIGWTLDQPGYGYACYGISSVCENYSYNTTLSTAPSLTLSGLKSGTTYTYHVMSCNSNGECSPDSSNATFTTSASTNGDTGTTTITLSNIQVSSTTSSSATITWGTNSASNSIVKYGVYSSDEYYGYDSNDVTSHSVTLTGLSKGTTYKYRVYSCASTGSCSDYSSESTFTTSASTNGNGTDSELPSVSSVYSGSTGISGGVYFDVSFSEEMDESTLTSDTVRLVRQSDNTTIDGSIYTWSYGFTLYPSSLLSLDDYLLTISTGVRDLAGNAMASTYETSIRTGSDDVVSGSAVLTGEVTDPTGAAVSGAYIYLYDDDYSFWYTATTDSSGAYKMSALPEGTMTVEVYPPYDSSELISPSPTTVTLTAETTSTVNFQFKKASKTITGTVSRSNGEAVTDAYISAYNQTSGGWDSAQTDSSGAFSMTVSGGTWQVYVYPMSSQADWNYFDSGITVEFADDSTTETTTISFVVEIASSKVTGKLLKPDGTPPEAYEAYVSFSDSTSGKWAGGSIDSSDGSFSFSVSPGSYYVYVWIDDETLMAPEIDPVTIGEDETVDLGTIYFTSMDEQIEGYVVDEEGNGVSNVYVYAYTSMGSGYASATSGSDGSFTLYVSAGTWEVYAYPDPSTPYTYSSSVTVEVTAGQVATVTLTVQTADATISGTVVDEDAEILTDVYGWVSAEDESSGQWYGGSVERGTFSFRVPAGTYTIWLYVSSGSSYFAGDPVTVEAKSGETTTVTLYPVLADALVFGSVLDSEGEVITDIEVEVYASNANGFWQWGEFDDETGQYSLYLSAGTWTLGVYVDPEHGYYSQPIEDPTITIESGEEISRDIVLVALDSVIQGQALTEDGEPVAGAYISVDLINMKEIEEVEFSEDLFVGWDETDSDGSFRVDVPAGTYYLHSYIDPGRGLISPDEAEVSVESDQTLDVTLVFEVPDLTISGTVFWDGEPFPAFVWAWAEEGGMAMDEAGDDGEFELQVGENDIWHVQAGYYTGDEFLKSDEVVIEVGEDDVDGVELELDALDIEVPEPTVRSVDVSDPQTITLDDGATLSLPANALGTEGQVTVTMSPTAEVSEDALHTVVGIPYEIEVVDESGQPITSLNTDATITFVYDEEALDELGIDEETLTIGYYDETIHAWRELDQYTVDTEGDTVTCTVDHFTVFAVLAVAGSAPTDEDEASPGDLIKGSSSSVYYYGQDGNRYVFPNEKTYFSWYEDFDEVKIVPDSFLPDLQLVGNVTYRPGVKMIKIQSSPKVYAVSQGGVLHWVVSEEVATDLYGADWNKKIDDISDAFFGNYTMGEDITDSSDYDIEAEMDGVPTIQVDKGL